MPASPVGFPHATRRLGAAAVVVVAVRRCCVVLCVVREGWLYTVSCNVSSPGMTCSDVAYASPARAVHGVFVQAHDVASNFGLVLNAMYERRPRTFWGCLRGVLLLPYETEQARPACIVCADALPSFISPVVIF